LSRYLRSQGAAVSVVASPAELVRGLESGRFRVGVTEALIARQIAYDLGGSAAWLPDPMARYCRVIGLWRGDTTLKRATVGVLRDVENSGELAAILRRYDLAPIGEYCPDCPSAAALCPWDGMPCDVAVACQAGAAGRH